MSQSYPYSWKQCATCSYWGGTRSTDRFGEHVSVDSSMTKGKCMNRSCQWSNQDKPAGFACNSFEKWPVLKQIIITGVLDFRGESMKVFR